MIIYEEILREFQKQKVKYILVGGIAVNLLGSFRNTLDLDVLLEMSDDNLKKAIGILKKKGYHIKQPVDPMGITKKAIREDWIKNKHLKALNFYKDAELKEVDIIIDTPISYKDAKRDIVWITRADITLPVASIDNLIKMKKKTGRMIDKLDIGELKKIKKLRERK